MTTKTQQNDPITHSPLGAGRLTCGVAVESKSQLGDKQQTHKMQQSRTSFKKEHISQELMKIIVVSSLLRLLTSKNDDFGVLVHASTHILLNTFPPWSAVRTDSADHAEFCFKHTPTGIPQHLKPYSHTVKMCRIPASEIPQAYPYRQDVSNPHI